MTYTTENGKTVQIRPQWRWCEHPPSFYVYILDQIALRKENAEVGDDLLRILRNENSDAEALYQLIVRCVTCLMHLQEREDNTSPDTAPRVANALSNTSEPAPNASTSALLPD